MSERDEIEVTPEMLEAGEGALWSGFYESLTAEEVAKSVFVAMIRAQKKNPATSEGSGAKLRGTMA